MGRHCQSPQQPQWPNLRRSQPFSPMRLLECESYERPAGQQGRTLSQAHDMQGILEYYKPEIHTAYGIFGLPPSRNKGAAQGFGVPSPLQSPPLKRLPTAVACRMGASSRRPPCHRGPAAAAATRSLQWMPVRWSGVLLARSQGTCGARPQLKLGQ
jgi:hypothetical protein